MCHGKPFQTNLCHLLACKALIIIIYLLLIPVGKFFSVFDPSVVIKEQWAAVKRLRSD